MGVSLAISNSVYGSGWFSGMNGRKGYISPLDGWTLTWGTTDPATQPDPSVLTISIITTEPAKTPPTSITRPWELSGAAITIADTSPATWDTARTARLGAWKAQAATVTWTTLKYTVFNNTGDLYAAWTNSDYRARRAWFTGIVNNGAELTHRKDGRWQITITASARSVLLKRSQDHGPTSTDARWAGYHWTGTSANRIDTVIKRAKNDRLPVPDKPEDALPSLRPYDAQDSPSLLDILHRAYSHAGILWYEADSTYVRSCAMHPAHITRPVALTMPATGTTPRATLDGRATPRIPASLIRSTDTRLDMQPPCKGIKWDTWAASSQDGKLSYTQATQQVAATGLSDNAQRQGEWLTIDSDAITTDTTGGLAGATTWQPDENEKTQFATFAAQRTMRVTPRISIDSDRLDPDQWPTLWDTLPAAIITTPTRNQGLADAQGNRIAEGPWITIGGTITYQARAGIPRVTQSLTIIPATLQDSTLDWQGTQSWQAEYHSDGLDLTWTQLGQITQITD